MLVISRKKNESLVINDDITIVVVEIRGDKVRLGVEAPKETPVHRNEVYEAIRRNMRSYNPDPWDDPRTSEPPSESPRCEPAVCTSAAVMETVQPAAAVAPPARDGLCCPLCGSDAVEVARIKVAYQGKELVRRRKCDPCGHEFHTVERVELL
jgi:carbon storage regulator